MVIKFLNKPSKDAVLLIPVFENEKHADKAVNSLIAKLTACKEFRGRGEETFFGVNLISGYPDKIVLAGLGRKEKLTTAKTMSALGAAVKSANKHNPAKLAIWFNPNLNRFAQAAAETAVLANYQTGALYKTGKAREKIGKEIISQIEAVALSPDCRKAFEKGVFSGMVTNEARDWGNAPPNYANGAFFEKTAKQIAKEIGAKCEILRRKELEKLGMGALLAVNRGSNEEPRLIILDYTPKGAPKFGQTIALVGKGLIFDSGGYNLKPRGHIEDMQLDKAGAAAVFGAARLLPKAGIKRRVIIAAPFTDNVIGPNTLKPSEIITTYAGKTVEITNTDGEGRLILADAIAYIIDKFKPACVVDIATLTGACMVALGERYAGLFGNNKGLISKLRKAGDETDELLWPLPMHKDYCAKMKGVYADLRNADIGSDRYAGASKGAAFIKEFAGKTRWAHIDIAAPAFTNDPKKYEQKGATGFGVRLLLRFLEKI